MTDCIDCNGPVGDLTPLAKRCSRCSVENHREQNAAGTRRKRNATKTRKTCFEAHRLEDDRGRTFMVCHDCGVRLDPAIDRWEADHIRLHAEGGDDGPDNVWPICVPCHREKSKLDTTAVAKGKRIGVKRNGIKRPKYPMNGSRASRYRKRMDGTVERR